MPTQPPGQYHAAHGQALHVEVSLSGSLEQQGAGGGKIIVAVVEHQGHGHPGQGGEAHHQVGRHAQRRRSAPQAPARGGEDIG